MPRAAYTPARIDSTIMTTNISTQLVREWSTFHHTMVKSTAQMNTTMSRQLPS